MFGFLNESMDEKSEKLSLFNENIFNSVNPVFEMPIEKRYSEDHKPTNESKQDQDKNDSEQIDSFSNSNKKKNLGKIRSKRARDKKRVYIQELESRVQALEKENVRLHNIIEQYKIDNNSELITK